MKISNLIKLNEFIPYFFIGGTATVIDWSIFWISITWLDLHYLPALVMAYITAGIFHYISNKIITFKCHSKQIGSQYTIYVLMGLLSLALSMGIIVFLIKIFLLEKMTARILTTLFMLVPNYLLHKHITFSKKLFIQPEV